MDTNDTFQNVTRRLSFFNKADGTARGSIINIDHNGNGTDAEVGDQTYGLDIHNNSGALYGILGHQYSSASAFMKIDNTDNRPAIEVFNTANPNRNPGRLGTGDAFNFSDANNGAATARFRITGKGNVYIVPADSSTGPGIDLTGSTTATANLATFRHNGPGKGVTIVQAAGAATFYPLQ